MKEFNDTMGPENIVLSYLAFAIIPTFPKFSTSVQIKEIWWQLYSLPEMRWQQLNTVFALLTPFAQNSKTPSSDSEYTKSRGESARL